MSIQYQYDDANEDVETHPFLFSTEDSAWGFIGLDPNQIEKEFKISFRYYQLDAIQAYEESRASGEYRGLIAVPTGGGKTVIFCNLEKRGRVLVLAHRDTLCDQALAAMKAMNPNLSVGMEKAEFTCSDQDHIVISSVQSLGTRRFNKEKEIFELSKRIKKWTSDTFDLVVVDEGHHCSSKSYLRILQYLEAGTRNGPYLLGVSATPGRSDNKQLADVFEKIIYEITLPTLVKEGYLCDIVSKKVYSDCDISDMQPPAEGSDLNEAELSRRINVNGRNSLIYSALMDHASKKKCIIIFAADVDHAETLSAHLKGKGMDCDYIHYKLSKTERADRLSRFKSGKLRILINVAILTEGFDNPRIDCVVLARPTASALLFSQMVGRGTRMICPYCEATDFDVIHENSDISWVCNKCLKFFSKKEVKNLLLLDVCDILGNIHIESAQDMFGIPDIDMLDEPIIENLPTINRAEELGITSSSGDTIENVRERIRLIESIENGISYIKTKAQTIDLFSHLPTPQTDNTSRFPWLKVAKDKFIIGSMSGKRIGVWKDGDTWKVGMGRTIEEISSRQKAPWGKVDKLVKRFLSNPIQVSPTYSIPEWKFITSDAKWRRREIKPNQQAELQKFGFTVPEGMSRGDAADKITWLKIIEKRKNYSVTTTT